LAQEHEKELLSRIIEATQLSTSPHKQISDAKLSPPASARLDVRELLQARVDGLPTLVEGSLLSLKINKQNS